MTDPIAARPVNGMVVITVDPETARVLAGAFAGAHADGSDLEGLRPTWFLDVAAVIAAAYEADVQRGCDPGTVPVPFFPAPRPVLTLVSGEPA